MASQPDLVLQTRGLSKSYGEVRALDTLDLRVPRGSIVGFLGPNGAGKSTTIKLLLGLIHPSAGSGTIFGLDIVDDSPIIRRRVGYLAQHPRFYAHMTARETLRFAARFFYSGPQAAIEQRIEESLALVGLSDKADRRTKGFSGGELQRLGIAQAQINDPDLLILDEPAAALDPMGRAQVLAIMERLRERATIFYSTHILDDVQRVSDRVVILNHGKLVSQGPIEDLLDGQEGTVYGLTLRGPAEVIRPQIEALPWVTSVRVGHSNGLVNWKVVVTDEEAADRHLLRTVLTDARIDVAAYGRQQAELEDIFMQLVSEGA